jgi:hypothetical protein
MGKNMLQKTILKFCLLCMLLTPVVGFAEDTKMQGPVAFLPEDVFEFQPVLEGSEVVHEFVIQNMGDTLLEILKIESG